MSKLGSMLVAIGGVGLAGYALSTHFTAESGPVAEVVVLPQKPKAVELPPKAVVAEPAKSVPGEAPNKAIATPGDRGSLARQLQRELKRVGCYDGEVNGQWTTSSRMAMKSFTDRVNASLPIDAPDYILLSLVQKHEGKACGTGCPSGQAQTEDGRCVPSAVLAKAGDVTPPEPKLAERPPTASWSPTAGALPFAAPAGLAPKGEPTPAAKSAAPVLKDEPRLAAKTDKQPLAEPEAEERRVPKRTAKRGHDGPVPEAGVYEKPRKRYAKSKPPKVVRKFLRNLQRGLAGLPF